MSKKVVIISIISIIVVAGGVVGFLFLTKPQPTSQPNPNSSQLVADTSKDYGACDILDKTAVKSTLGSAADNLQGPDNVGRIYSPNGNESQLCVYSFVPGGTIDTVFNADNGLRVEVYVFKDEQNRDARLDAEIRGETAVTGVGDSATFLEQEDKNLKLTKFILTVFSGLRSYTYTITQPTAELTFTESSAEAALTTLAKSVSYEE